MHGEGLLGEHIASPAVQQVLPEPSTMSNPSQTSLEQPQKSGTLPVRLDRSAPLAVRIAEAKAGGLLVGTIYARSSAKGWSTERQVAECIAWGDRQGIYVPSEFIFVDRAGGRTAGRAALRRADATLDERTADVLLIADVARAFRDAIEGVMYLLELVKKGVRVIAVHQAIDVTNEESARLLTFEAMCASTVREFRRRRAAHKARLRDGRDDTGD